MSWLDRRAEPSIPLGRVLRLAIWVVVRSTLGSMVRLIVGLAIGLSVQVGLSDE